MNKPIIIFDYELKKLKKYKKDTKLIIVESFNSNQLKEFTNYKLYLFNKYKNISIVEIPFYDSRALINNFIDLIKENKDIVIPSHPETTIPLFSEEDIKNFLDIISNNYEINTIYTPNNIYISILDTIYYLIEIIQPKRKSKILFSNNGAGLNHYVLSPKNKNVQIKDYIYYNKDLLSNSFYKKDYILSSSQGKIFKSDFENWIRKSDLI